MSKTIVLFATLLVLMAVSGCAVINTRTQARETKTKYESKTTVSLFIIPIMYNEKTINKVNVEADK